MKWITNEWKAKGVATFDLLVILAKEYCRNDWRKWLHSHTTGFPKKTEHYSSEELWDMGYIGIYRLEEPVQ